MNKNIFITRKGFTLMEILFVVLVIALVVSFAMPAIRSVRFDMKNARAKAALKKVAEARRNYYETTKGGDFINTPHFYMGSARVYAEASCANLAASGVPGSAAQDTSGVDEKFKQLFACGFLDWKDFQDLPYNVWLCDISSQVDICNGNGNYVAAKASGNDAGSKYVAPYYMYIDINDMQVRDNED